jgi:flagellar assembly factor FliW
LPFTVPFAPILLAVRCPSPDDFYRGYGTSPTEKTALMAPVTVSLLQHHARPLAMQLCTTQFGTIEIHSDDVLFFPEGLIGFERCQQWVLLADPETEAVGWLQSINRPDVALAVVSPRRFAPHYCVRIPQRSLQPLQLADSDQAYILAVVGGNDHALTMNLKAPLIVNLQRRLGRQVITLDDQPLQYEFASRAVQLRKTA